jgi:hypothetical protein
MENHRFLEVNQLINYMSLGYVSSPEGIMTQFFYAMLIRKPSDELSVNMFLQ